MSDQPVDYGQMVQHLQLLAGANPTAGLGRGGVALLSDRAKREQYKRLLIQREMEAFRSMEETPDNYDLPRSSNR